VKTELTAFPAQDPPESLLKEWIEHNDPIVRHAFGALLRGETPTALLKLQDSATADLSDLAEIVIAADMAADVRARAQMHNCTVRKLERDKRAAQFEFAQRLRDHRDQLAKLLEKSLRPNAELRYKVLAAAHKDGAHNAFKGDLMYNDLLALQGKSGVHEEVVDHEKALELIRDSPLPDGCSSQIFANVINTVIRDHLPHLERAFDGTAGFSRWIVRRMPPQNQAEGRALIRELELAGTLGNTATVLSRCTRIVLESQSPEARAAAATAAFARNPLAACPPCRCPALHLLLCLVRAAFLIGFTTVTRITPQPPRR
jgi:hypothetical protein